MKKRIKYLIIPIIALIFAIGFNFVNSNDSKAYMVNWGDCSPMDIGTMQCSGGEDVTYDGIVKVTVTSSDVEKTIKEYDRYKFANLYMSNSTGEMIDGYRFFAYTNEFLTESGYYSKIAQIVNDEAILYEASSIDKVPQEKKIEVIEYVLDEIFTFNNKLSCSDGYFYSSVAQRCVWNEDIAIPDRYLITDFEVIELQQWSEGTVKWTHDNKVRDTIVFNLPKDVEWAVQSIDSITITYNTCKNKTDGVCDETNDMVTVTYKNDGSITITRTDDRKKIDTIPNMGLTSVLAEVEANHPNALAEYNEYKRLFKSRKASNLAESYRNYLVLNVDDTMYIEMIEVQCTLINGQQSIGATEGSVVKDSSTKITTLSLIWNIFKYGCYVILGIIALVIAVIILKPAGKVVSDVSESRKQKSIAKTRKNSKRH